MRSYAMGQAGDFPLTLTADGYSWEIPAGLMTIRYTAVIKDGTWREVGDRIMPEKEPVRFFETRGRGSKDRVGVRRCPDNQSDLGVGLPCSPLAPSLPPAFRSSPARTVHPTRSQCSSRGTAHLRETAARSLNSATVMTGRLAKWAESVRRRPSSW